MVPVFRWMEDEPVQFKFMKWAAWHNKALALDAQDVLADMRNKFLIPLHEQGQQIYFLGNSLGLQPKELSRYLDAVLKQWQDHGVEAFFTTDNPWLHYHNRLAPLMATLVGAKPSEISIMNQLTVNLHLLLVSFYKPEGKKVKILCEQKAFPSDQYMLETHLNYLGLSPSDSIIEVVPREGESCLRTEDIISTIEKHADELALVFLGGVNYYTGQVLEMEAIAAAAHKHNIRIGYDLAHAAGNVSLQLHDWNVDFAAWCTYKYINGGPGGVSAVFIHEQYHQDRSLHRFGGWFGQDRAAQFKMEKGFQPIPTAEGWQLSTPSMLLYASLHASLDLFQEAEWPRLQEKQALQKAFLWELLEHIVNEKKSFTILTPEQNRGAQVSLYFPNNGRKIYDALMAKGIIVDWREPNVIRLAPVPLYNTFTDIWTFATTLNELL